MTPYVVCALHLKFSEGKMSGVCTFSSVPYTIYIVIHWTSNEPVRSKLART